MLKRVTEINTLDMEPFPIIQTSDPITETYSATHLEPTNQ